MPDIVYCDNKDCVCYDDYYERCDAYRLVIERGVCVGSSHGLNTSENDLDEQLKAENAKLRELVRQMYPGAKAFLQLGVQLGCNDTLSYDWWLQLRELGIEECAYEYS